MGSAVIQAKNIIYRYKDVNDPVLSDLSLSIGEGEFVGILGPNGAGKSTLLRAFAGLLVLESGCSYLYGQDYRTLSRRQIAQKLAFVPQNAAIWQDFTCREIVEMGCYARYGSLGNSEGSDAALKAMQDTDTLSLADRSISELSGGEVQRVRIAQALAQNTSVLLLDEPTNHLDICFQIEIMDLVLTLNRERRLTVVVVLHDLNLAAQYCSRLIMLKKGVVAADGAPSAVLTRELIKRVFKVDAEIIGEKCPRIFVRSNLYC